MSEIRASDFKAKCLELMDRVAERQTSYVITKWGRPVAKLVPVDPPKASVLGALAGRFQAVGDIVASPYSDDEWDVLRDSQPRRARRRR